MLHCALRTRNLRGAITCCGLQLHLDLVHRGVLLDVNLHLTPAWQVVGDDLDLGTGEARKSGQLLTQCG
jgi:hypothetical protein